MSEMDVIETVEALDSLVVESVDETLSGDVVQQDDPLEVQQDQDDSGTKLHSESILPSSSGDINDLEEHPHNDRTILVSLQDTASMSTDRTDAEVTIEKTADVVPSPEELLSPEEQRRAIRLAMVEGNNSLAIEGGVDVEAIVQESSKVATEAGQPTRKKKPTSTERRALRDAKRAAVDAATAEGKNPSNEDGDAPDARESLYTETPNSLGEVSVKTKRPNSKQRKARAKRLAAEKETENVQDTPSVVTASGSVDISPKATEKAPPPEKTSDTAATPAEIKPKAKKLGSRERKALKLAREAALVVDANATSVLPAVVEPPAADATDATPKARKLNSKQRKARKRAAEAAAATLAALSSAVVSAAAASVPQPPLPSPIAAEKSEQERTKKVNNKPKQAAVVSDQIVSAEVKSPAVSAAKPTQTKSAAAVKADTVDSKKAVENTTAMLSMAPNAVIALHATLAVLRQGLLSRDSVIYTQQGAMKMHLLTELCKLGYECVEGNAASFQHISWSAVSQCLTYTGAIVNAPLQYPAALRPKGELKIASPALSLRLKCYPAFGAESPALMGKKSFRNGFVGFVKEVVLGEADSFVFVLPLEVYIEFALDAMGSLPAVRDIKRHISEYHVAYGLRALSCTVETAYGEFVIGSLIVA